MLVKNSRTGNAQPFSAFDFFTEMGTLCNGARLFLLNRSYFVGGPANSSWYGPLWLES
jgi:hypothetical protein